MRTLLILLVATWLILPTASAQPVDRDSITNGDGSVEPSTTLDTLFFDLKRARIETEAERIAARIWARWFQSGSASIDLMMQWANDAVKDGKFAVALDFLDQITILAPDYAEGWNRRATLHFRMNNYAKSMADIQKTLDREPRHFGALSGMGMILKNTGNKKMALQAYRRVLEVYPMLRAAQMEVETLSDELAGEGI